MSGWHVKNLGDAMLSGQALEEISNIVDTENKKAADKEGMAVFVRHESEGHLHCEVKIYFTPAAANVADALLASPCVRPAPGGLDLLAGDAQAWALFKEPISK